MVNVRMQKAYHSGVWSFAESDVAGTRFPTLLRTGLTFQASDIGY